MFRRPRSKEDGTGVSTTRTCPPLSVKQINNNNQLAGDGVRIFFYFTTSNYWFDNFITSSTSLLKNESTGISYWLWHIYILYMQAILENCYIGMKSSQLWSWIIYFIVDVVLNQHWLSIYRWRSRYKATAYFVFFLHCTSSSKFNSYQAVNCVTKGHHLYHRSSST